AVCLTVAPARAGEARVFFVEGRLAKDDPRDAVRKQSGHKVHLVKLEAGQCYQIDLASKDFDTFLRLEDAQKKQLGFNDDLDEGNKILDSRLFFAPLESSTYRLIVTSFEGGAAGAYTLRFRELAEVDRQTIERGQLTKEDKESKGQRFQLKPLKLKAGRAY